tara:strand:- start:1117 stop:1377 length:261 start_codon:yes stop_codon:yes gene_type:complete
MAKYIVSNISQTDNKTELDHHSVRGPGISRSYYNHKKELEFNHRGTVENALMIHPSELQYLLDTAFTAGYKLKSNQLNDLISKMVP